MAQRGYGVMPFRKRYGKSDGGAAVMEEDKPATDWAPSPADTQMRAAVAPSQPQRRGMGGVFGGIRNWLGSRDWELIAASMRDDPSILEALHQRRADNRLFDFQARRWKREEANEETERTRLQEALDLIEDPVQRAWAAIAPAQAASRFLAPPETPNWDIDPVTGQPYTVTAQGGVQYGQGRINVRPTGGAERAPPSGYRWTPDGNLEPITGGPADPRNSENAGRDRRRLEAQVQSSGNVLNSIERARGLAQVNDIVGMEATTGLAGQVFGGLGGTPAHDLQGAVDSIISNLGFDSLAQMRSFAESGASGLGQVTIYELQMLQSRIASLRISQSRTQFLANLQAVEQQYQRYLQAAQQDLRELNGETGGNQPRVIELDPE